MKSILIVIGSILLPCLLWATGEPSTYFNIFVPPNNDPVQRNVCLVITAIYDGTTFEIIDDDMDGDSDDSRSGVLYAGQSYVLYLKDNGINDDARYASGGVWKQDGDYFIIRASKLVYASQSTDSDWQHDWLPSISKSSLGTKFILYTPKKTSSNRDLNVFAYQPNTVLTIRRISWANSLLTGLTHVNLDTQQVVTQVTLNPGEDIIYKNTHGRDLLISGETYVIETNKPVTVQYGALYGNERDGGGYVPTSNGSSSGELMYFAVPYQSLGEQEIRIVSWSNDNAVQLDRYSNGTWVPVKSWNLQQRRFAEWVGKSNGNVSYPTVFRLTCSAGKKVSVFEGNWFETGSPGTSDMATMVSSENGTSSGTYFLTYLAPPGNQQNVRNPFTGSLFGQALTHVFLFSQDTAQVTVRDAYTQGAKINRTYTILPNRYVDCYLNLNEWKSIYNGTGTAVGPERPYLEVFSDNPISVMNTNFNDNWMMYFGSSQEQRLKAEISSSVSQIAPGQTCQVVSKVTNESAREGTIVQVSLQVAGGFDVISSTLSTSASTELYEGTPVPGADATIVEYDYSGTVRAQEEIQITTTLLAKPISNQGTLLPNNSTQTLEVQVTAQYNGLLEQSVASQGISLLSGNLSSYQFQPLVNSTLEQHLSNSWSASWVDLDGDGWEDVFLTEYNKNQYNRAYRNNGSGNFTSLAIPGLTDRKGIFTSSSWADMDNDGDQDLLLTAVGNCQVFRNDAGTFTKLTSNAMALDNGYYHGACWADYDRDGKLDVFVYNYHPTRFNELYHNEGNCQFRKTTLSEFPTAAGKTTGASWTDINLDGFPDLFVPMSFEDSTRSNLLFVNQGNGTFKEQTPAAIRDQSANSVGSCWGDWDNDGDPDLLVSNASNQHNFLFRNDRNGTCTFLSSSPVSNHNGNSHGCVLADFDHNGFLDCYISNDKGQKYLYFNQQGNFTRNTTEIVTGLLGNTISSAVSDFDKDGDLDISLATHGAQKNFVFKNNGSADSWSQLKLQGTVSNKSGVGAYCRWVVNNQSYHRWHYPHQGFGSQHSQ
nr:VCBS repeat-containing protein [Cytophagaceae bacterium]